jgi:hypothetical protein
MLSSSFNQEGSKMTISQHLQERCQQSGISSGLVLLLNAIGMETQLKGNTYVLQFDKHTQKVRCKKLKQLLMQVQCKVFALISADDKLTTSADQH